MRALTEILFFPKYKMPKPFLLASLFVPIHFSKEKNVDTEEKVTKKSTT